MLRYRIVFSLKIRISFPPSKSEYMFIHYYSSKIIEEKNIRKHFAGWFKEVITNKSFFFPRTDYNKLLTQFHVSWPKDTLTCLEQWYFPKYHRFNISHFYVLLNTHRENPSNVLDLANIFGGFFFSVSYELFVQSGKYFTVAQTVNATKREKFGSIRK